VALAAKALLGGSAFPLRAVLALVFLFPLPVIGPGTLAAWADALVGRAVRVSGAEALASRRAGWSLRLPDGHFAEFILWNPWPDLEPGRRYMLLLGARSRVVVERPEPEP
jgi:hypothetical protein